MGYNARELECNNCLHAITLILYKPGLGMIERQERIANKAVEVREFADANRSLPIDVSNFY